MTYKSVRWAFNFAKWNPTEKDILLATSCIQLEEKDRLERFVFKKDFKSSLIGRLMMRKFVHEATTIPYNEIRFDRDDKGKPFLTYPKAESAKVAFNVSHHGNYVVLAGEMQNQLLGIDIMKMEYLGTRTLSEYFRIMKKPFSDLEWVEIKGAKGENEQIAMFCRHWCLKESYVKAIGVGITINLQDISFKINSHKLALNSPTTDTELYVNLVKENWSFQETLIDNEHCVAVAMCKDETINSDLNVTFTHMEFSTLIDNAVPLFDYDRAYCNSFFLKKEIL